MGKLAIRGPSGIKAFAPCGPLISKGKGTLAMRVWRPITVPVKGLRRLINGIGKFAIRACRPKIDPVKGLRRLISGIGQLAIRACRPKIAPV